MKQDLNELREDCSLEQVCGKGAQTRHKCIEVFAFAQINLHKSKRTRTSIPKQQKTSGEGSPLP